MQIIHPNAQPPTPEELQSLEQLRIVIYRAIADGKVSKMELDIINAQIRADHKVTFDELGLLRELVLSKLQAGDLEWEWD